MPHFNSTLNSSDGRSKDGTAAVAIFDETAPEGAFTQGTMLQVGELSCVVQQFLSTGGHANVYRVTLMQDGTARVLKHISFGAHTDEPEYRRYIEHEIEYMTQLKGHPNIVGLEAAQITSDSAFILMEHCAGDVLSLMNGNLRSGLEESTILHIFCDVCKAVAHMHYQPDPILHRDLKVENILASSAADAEHGEVYKLCDFGSATTNIIAADSRLSRREIVAMEEEIQRMTTLEYRAPEMIDLYLRRGITEKVDIWALGVLLYKLCYFKTPFDNASPLAILNAEYSTPSMPAYSKQLLHIFQMTMREEPRERSNIYTLCTYVCALRGEPCALENRYASPTLAPTSSIMSAALPPAQGLGYVSAQPFHQPRRYAASSANSSRSSSRHLDLSHSTSDAVPELDSDSIVPMRRGRPPKPQSGSIGSATAGFKGPAAYFAKSGASNSAGGRLLLSDNRAALRSAPATPMTEQPSPAPYARSGSSASVRSYTSRPRQITDSPLQTPVEPLQSASVQPNKQDRGRNALGIYNRETSESEIETDIASGSGGESTKGGTRTRRMRMSVKAPDGRESLSMDFVQGAVFGSSRRASVLRRKASVASNTSVLSYTGSRGANSGTNGAADMFEPERQGISGDLPISADSAAEVPTPGLPGFVSQPLPPPPQSSSSLSPKRVTSDIEAKENQPESNLSDEELSMAAMITPLSLHGAFPGTAPLSSDSTSFADTGAAAPTHESSEWSVATASENQLLASRLSTILETAQDEVTGTVRRRSQTHQLPQREPVNSIYDMTLDKLEDESRFSTLFDDQSFFGDAKAKYAAQRSSVYQSPDNYFNSDSQVADAQANWNALSPVLKNSMLHRIDEHSSNGQPNTGNDDFSEESGDTMDVDSVLQRARQRNHQKLIAQNNRRSMYISSPTAGDPSTILQEDVEDNMRVLTENEVDQLLKRMDMYNRELLSEQQRWQRKDGGQVANNANIQSLDQIIAQANDHLLRSEQSMATAPTSDPTGTEDKHGATSILQNVISAAKSTFSKTASSTAAVSSSPAILDTSAPIQVRADSEETAVTASWTPTPTAEETLAADKLATSQQHAKITIVPTAAVNKSNTPDSPVYAGPVTETDQGSNTTAIGSPLASPTLPPENIIVACSPGIETTESPITSSTKTEASQSTATVPGVSTASPVNSTRAVTPKQKIPEMPRMHSDSATLAGKATAVDPLADLRARLKKKQSSPQLSKAKSASQLAAPGNELPRPSTMTSKNTAGKPKKSVRNLVAMFEKP
ncbi:Ark- serine/threonine protein kinase [Coemansia sp. RSA 1365]|nr:Ark- serine/threonine protein kinase [Coemansia sp. RSA 1365]